MHLKPLLLGFLIAAGAMAPASLAEDPSTQINKPANQETKRLARSLIEQILQVTHAEQLFGDMRRTLREVYIPAVRDLVQGDFPGTQPDPKAAAQMARLLTFLTYLNKAGDEVNASLAENRQA